MPVSKTGSDQGWAEQVEVVEWYRDGDRARAARGTTHSRAKAAWSMKHYEGTKEDDGHRLRGLWVY